MTNKRNPEVSTIGQVRTLNPSLPMVRPDGTISLEQVDATFHIETVGRLIAQVLSLPDQGMSPLEAACATYIAQKMYAGEEVRLTPDISSVIMKAFTKKLEDGVLPPHAHAIMNWMVSPEDDSVDKYREALDTLYSGLDAKKKAAAAKIKELNEQSIAARAILKQAPPQAN